MATIEEITAFHAYLRYLFVTRYNSLCFHSIIAWNLLKRAAFCVNSFENKG